MVYKWLNNVQNWLLPPACLVCGQASHNPLSICPECHKDLNYIDYACPRCAIPMPFSGQHTLCGRCQQKAPAFDQTLSLFHFETPIRQLIHGMKFNKRLSHAELLGNLLATTIQQQHEALPQALVPVPLTKTRLRHRGFNQALELAKPVSRQLHIPIFRNQVIRKGKGPAQSSLDLKQRRRNVRGSFLVKPGQWPEHVAIVDDVMTSGSTCHELARSLKKQGVRQVTVWCIARASLQ